MSGVGIGVVDVVRILDESKAGRAFSGKLRAIAEKWQKQLGELEKKLEQTQERLAKGAEAGSPALPIATAFKLQRDQRIFEIELQSVQERLRFDIDTHREFYRDELLANLEPLLASVAKSKGLSLILRSPPKGVPFAAPGTDVTDEVIAILDT